MSEQAIETDEVVDTGIVEEVEVNPDENSEDNSEEVEIVLEGEEQPTSKPVPLNKFLNRVNKLNGKVEAANTEAEAANQRVTMLEEENKLLRLHKEQPLAKPKLEDFDSDAEYETAQTKYDDARIDEAVKKQTANLIQQNNTQNNQAQHSQVIESSLKAHYERAGKLNVSDFEATEDIAIEIFGNDVSKNIMANTENSEVLLYYLGKNPAKAQQYAQDIQQNPVKAMMAMGGLAAGLKVKPKSSQVADPEETIAPGGAIAVNKDGPKGATFT